MDRQTHDAKVSNMLSHSSAYKPLAQVPTVSMNALHLPLNPFNSPLESLYYRPYCSYGHIPLTYSSLKTRKPTENHGIFESTPT